MITGKPMHLSLTGDRSHLISIPAGQGSFSIGTTGLSKGQYDAWVNNDSVIHWNAFDGLRVPAGYHWPRWFYYSGNDTGFIDWASQRRIEEFGWYPERDAKIDLTDAIISSFFLHTNSSKIVLSTGDHIRDLHLSGSLENISVEKCTTAPRLRFKPLSSKTEGKPYRLPDYKPLHQASSIHVECSPIGQAFDCSSLLQFVNLTELLLEGNMTNMDALGKLKRLEKIWFWYIPDLSGMPSLTVWENLVSFAGINIEETEGKVLRAELNRLKKMREFSSHSTVSKLRKPIWFETEYGIPFSNWESTISKKATKAYKACLSQIRKSTTESEVRKAIVEFVEVINRLPDIETVERDDVSIAVSQLVESSTLGISKETGSIWLDDVRDF